MHPFADVLLPEPEHDAGAMAPAGQWWSTVADLARFVALLAGDASGAGVVSDGTLAEMSEAVVVEEGPNGLGSGYGLGLAGVVGGGPARRRARRVDARLPRRRPGRAGVARRRRGDDQHDDRPQHGDRRGPAPAARRARAGAPRRLDADRRRPGRAGDRGALVLGARALPSSGCARTGCCTSGPMGDRARASRLRPRDGTWVGLDEYYAGEVLRVVRHDDGSGRHLDLGSFVLTRTPYDPAADVPGGVDEAGWR